MSNRTVRRCLNKQGYGFMQCRKKGLLYPDDSSKRVKFARKCKRLSQAFWKKGVSFYLDGAGWAHKTNPASNARTQRTRTWRRRGKGLKLNCTAKGRKERTGGEVAKFVVAIAHGKDVIKCQQYEGNINGDMFFKFIDTYFPEMFYLVLSQDGDPSQNCKLSHVLKYRHNH